MAVSTFLGLETALRGILAQQQALDVTGHNIANANTPGYSRQVVSLSPVLAYPPDGVNAPVGVSQLGGGVEVSDVSRVRDQFLDNQYRAQTMRSGYFQSLSDGLQQVDQSLGEPGSSGLSTLLQGFWSAWQGVANDPESSAARTALVQSGVSLASGIQQLDSQLTTFQSQNTDLETQTVDQLNSYTSNIADLNTQIAQAQAVGGTPNDLLDARDSLVDKVENLVNGAVSTNSDGTVTITIGTGASKQTLVDGTTGATAVTFADLTTANPPDPAALNNGSLQGLVDYGAKLTSYASSLDTFATTLATAVNDQQKLGYDLNGNAGTDFFSATGAGDIAVTAAMQASPALVAAGATANPGDSDNAIAIANIANQAGGPDDLYQQLVTQVGSDTQAADNSNTAAQTLLTSIQNRRLSTSGVSLDEEMTNLLQYQRGFQASARALTAMDDMINLLVTGTGRVGL